MKTSLSISLLFAVIVITLFAAVNAVYLDKAFEDLKNFHKFDLEWDYLEDFYKEIADAEININDLTSEKNRSKLLDILVQQQIYLTSAKQQKEWATSESSKTQFEKVFEYNFRGCPEMVKGFSSLIGQIELDPNLLNGINQTTLNLMNIYKVCKFLNEDENIVNDTLETLKQNHAKKHKSLKNRLLSKLHRQTAD